MTNKHFPPGWDEERVRRVLSHYEKQTDEEAAAEDEAAFEGKGRTVIEVPFELMPVIREIIAQYKAAARA
jgi:activator of 2-hydroxyglutaryl-CoA dehydratase